MKINYENYVDKAEKVIMQINNDKYKQLPATTQLRNILDLTQNIYEKINGNKGGLSEEEIAEVQLLRVRLTYDSGRHKDVKNFVEEASLRELLKTIGKDREKLKIYCRYMEALVAYHKFYGGK